MKKNNVMPLASSLILTLFISACNSEDDSSSDGSGDASGYRSITVDASSRETYAYVSVTEGLVDEQSDWHIAFKRTGIVLNDGIEAALVAEQSDFYDANGEAVADTFVNATADNELEHLVNATAAEDDAYSGTSTAYAINNSYEDSDAFVAYDPSRHVLQAVDTLFWIVKSADGDAYAKLRVTQIAANDKNSADTDAYDTAIIELALAADATTTFADAVSWEIITLSGTGEGCYDIDSGAEVDCTSATWDISYSNSAGIAPTIKLNSGVSGDGAASALGAFDYANYAQYQSAIQDGDDYDLTAASWTYGAQTDSEVSVFVTSPWYTYNLQGSHGIWPNYRVYHVRDPNDASVSAFIQLVNYYDDALTSGHITLRYNN